MLLITGNQQLMEGKIMESRIRFESGINLPAQRRFAPLALLGIVAASVAILSGSGVSSASAPVVAFAASSFSQASFVAAGTSAGSNGPGHKQGAPTCSPDWTIFPSPNQ